MGNDFFWFYDVFVVAVAAATLYNGAKKGAVSVLISAVSAVIAFVVAFTFTGVISDRLYDNLFRDRIEDYMEQRLGNVLNEEMISGLSQADMSKTKIGDAYLAEIVPEYDDRGNALLDLSKTDLTETGIDKADLRGFGIGKDFDWSLVKLGHISVSKTDVEKYGLGNIVLSYVIASNLTSGDVFHAFTDIGDKLSETVSPSLKTLGNDLSAGSRDAIYSITVSIITMANGTYGDRIMDDIVTPTVMFPLKAIVFCILFALVMLILALIANVSKLINKIPIVSSVNGVGGAVLGLLEGGVILLLVCIVIRLLIAVCGSSLVFLNEMTIDRTFIFRYIYSFDPLTFFGLT